jgi:hypothetical protein
MSRFSRTFCVATLLVSSAVLISVGCSDDTSKKVRGIGDAGEGGAAGEVASGGKGGTPAAGGIVGVGGAPETEAGAAGVAPVGAGGAPEAGAGGEPAISSEAGAGGAPEPLACLSGNVTNVTLSEVRSTICRGAVYEFSFLSSTMDDTFTCCGTLGTSSIPITVSAVGNGDGGGEFSFQVPDDAIPGDQALTLSCSSGPVSDPLLVTVSTTLGPVVTSSTPSFHTDSGQSVTITGTNLLGVNVVSLVGSEGAVTDCAIDAASHTDTSITCSGSPPQGTYTLIVSETDCGQAVNTPSIEVLPPT